MSSPKAVSGIRRLLSVTGMIANSNSAKVAGFIKYPGKPGTIGPVVIVAAILISWKQDTFTKNGRTVCPFMPRPPTSRINLPNLTARHSTPLNPTLSMNTRVAMILSDGRSGGTVIASPRTVGQEKLLESIVISDL